MIVVLPGNLSVSANIYIAALSAGVVQVLIGEGRKVAGVLGVDRQMSVDPGGVLVVVVVVVAHELVII